jgi:hypothetical protein
MLTSPSTVLCYRWKMALKARAPRVPITPLHRVHIELATSKLNLSNISTSGMGILVSEGELSNGTLLKGQIIFEKKVGTKKVEFVTKVVHVTKNIAGTHFQPPNTDLKEAIREFFKLELAGLSTMKVDPKYHKKQEEGTSTWITGDGCDLYILMSGDQLIRFKLTFLGNHFIGSADKPLYVGQVSSPDLDDSGLRYKGSELMEDVAATQELIESALKVLEYIPHLSTEHRAMISKMIKT